MNIEPLGDGALPELEAFYRTLGMKVETANLRQYSLPREAPGGIRVVTLALRDAGRMVGTIGWIDLPLAIARASGGRAEATRHTARWPINQYLLPEYRGRGLGRDLMESTRQGAECRLVIGGNAASIPILDRTGYRAIGDLARHQWTAGPLRAIAPWKLRDRLRSGRRATPPAVVRAGGRRGAIVARRVDRLSGWLPWTGPHPGGAPLEAGVPRDADYLEFAFGGALRPWHSLHAVDVDGALSGYFVLAARADRPPLLTAEIVDLDAAPGYERDVIRGALGAAFRCADVVRLRLCGERFARALSGLAPRSRITPDHPLRISCAPGSPFDEAASAGAAAWKLTYGDHDQYRVRSASCVWEDA